MVRATTGGVMKTYRSNLMNSFINMNANRNTVLSQRIFNSFAEDPATAARAFRLRKSRMTVESQHNICADVMKKYETAFSCLQANDDVLCTKEGVYGEYMKTLTGTTLKMLNDPTGDARTQLTKVLDQMSQTLVQTMNQKYGDNFIFAGADGHNVPFEIRDNVLYYRGVRVDAFKPDVLTDEKGGPIAVDEKGQIIDDPTYQGPVYYLRMESYNVKTISKKEYEDLYMEPKRQSFADYVNKDGRTTVGTTMYAYNSVGDLIEVEQKVNEDGEPEVNEDGEPVYSFKYPDEESKHPNDKFITLNGDNIYYKVTDGTDEENYLLVSMNDSDQFKIDLQDPLSGDKLVRYDENGRINYEGGYYQRIYEDGSTKMITQQEYEETFKRANDPDNLPVRLTDADGNVVSVNEDGAMGGDGYYRIVDASQRITPKEYEQQKLEWEKLQYLAQETQFVDIGFGFQENDRGELIESSAFNAALSGLNFLGYGVDEDGDPKNLYSLVQKLRAVAESVDADEDWNTATWDEFDRLVSKFEAGVSDYQTQFANLAASTTKLENQQGLLEDNFYNLQEQYSDLEDVDMVDAITSFIWAEYCYNAALKVGNSILSESLMDYLR